MAIGGAAAALGAAGGWAPAASAATPTLIVGRAAGAPLSAPRAVAVDAAGDTFIADTAGDTVYELAPDGTLTAIASGLAAPGGVAVDAAGDVYIADTGDHQVDELVPGGSLSVVASGLGSPSGLAVDAAGDVYIADSGSHRVDRLAPGGTLSVVAGSGVSGSPAAGAATSSPLNAPVGVAVDGSGNLFIADSGADVIEKVTASGALSVFAGRSGRPGWPYPGTATRTSLNQPSGVAVDSSGAVYIADAGNNLIEKVASGKLSYLAGTGWAAAPTYGATATASSLDAPAGVAAAADGIFYIADTANGTVDRLTPAPPAATVAPPVTGSAKQGATLTAGPGTWSNSPTSYAYQWQDCTPASGCVNVSGATAPTYQLQAADVGDTVRVVVTASNVGGTGSQASAATAAVLPLPPAVSTAPSIGGSATDAQTLTAVPGAWSDHPTSFAYRWQQCDADGGGCTDIDGATHATYTLVNDDLGSTLRVVVTAANAGGSGTATSDATAPVAPAVVPWADTPPPAAQGAPLVIGGTGLGQTLSCSAGVWSGAPTSYSYQWSRDLTPIDGANAAQYTLTGADLGQTLTCTVAADNAGGTIQADSAPVSIPGAGSGSRAAAVSAGASCPAAVERVTGTALGTVRLGFAHARADACLGLPGGAEIQAVYPSTRLVASLARAHGSGGSLSGRVVLAVSTDPGYILHGLRVRDPLRGGGLGRTVRARGAEWHVFSVRGALGLVEARRGAVREIGIASRALSTRALRGLLARVTR